MKVRGIRFCAVVEEAREMAEFFTGGLGLPERDRNVSVQQVLDPQ